MIQIQKVRPQQLGRFINWFAIYHFHDEAPVRMYPEGFFELVFQVGSNFFQISSESDKWEKRPMQFIGGLHNKSYSIKPQHSNSSLISVKFKPNSARYFIPEKLQLFKNKLVRIDDVFKRSSLGRLEELYGQSSALKAIWYIEEFLATILIDKPDSRIDHVLDAIASSKGIMGMKELASYACLSDSQFRNRFNEEVGMSPKEYSKIVRIKHISETLFHNPTQKLTELTYEMGYFDQAHFIKDFKSVMGVSPRQFMG
jgi:AraC-like DNA-binding protein